MKKLLVIAGAVLMASFANAAAVQWNSGLFTEGFTGPDGATLAKSTDYTMIVSFYSDANGATLVTDSTVTSAKPNGAYNAKTGDLFSNGKTYYVSAILKANDGTVQRLVDLSAFTLGDTGDANINFTSGAGFDTAGNKWGAWETVGGGDEPDTPSEDVPEPTSGLLLLVGAAALALRRRRA
jgi:hypothetical protein